MDPPHLPALRLGRAYESLAKTEVRDHRSGEPVAAVSHVNAGIIRRDLVRLRGLARDPEEVHMRAIDRDVQAGGRSLPERHFATR